MPCPLVSVIIIARGPGKFPKESLNSVMSQSFRNFELLLIDYDSGNRPKTGKTTYKDIQIRYFKHCSDNLNSARNLGLNHAGGKYIVFMDNCDIWENDKLKKQADILEKNPDIGLVYCGGRLEGYVFDRLVMKNFLYNSSVAMFRKDCLEKAGLFDESLDIASNWDFFLRLSLFYKFTGINEPLAKSALPVKNGLNGCEYFKTSGFKVLNKIFQMENITAKQLRLVNLAYAMRYSYIGRRYFQNNCYDRAKGYFNEALKRDFSICFRSDILLFYLLSCYLDYSCKHHAE